MCGFNKVSASVLTLPVISTPFAILQVKYFTTQSCIGYGVLHLIEIKLIVKIYTAVVKLAQTEQTCLRVDGN
jgi:hypothetical protein